MLKQDAHLHVNFCGFDANDIINYLDNNHFEQCWLLSWEEKQPPIPSIYEHLPVTDLMQAYHKYPDRIVPFYAPDPGSDNPKLTLSELMKQGIKGCGELKVTYKWEDDIMESYLQIISELKLPLLFHMESSREHFVNLNDSKTEKLLEPLMNGAFNGAVKYYLSKRFRSMPFLGKAIAGNFIYFPGYLFDFEHLERRIRQFPDIAFIGHGPHFWNNIALNQSAKYTHQTGKIKGWGIIDRLLEENSNFYCDISGKSGFNALTRDKYSAKQFLEKHADKIIFGTDNTIYNFTGLMESFKLPKEKLEKIYYYNAKKIIP